MAFAASQHSHGGQPVTTIEPVAGVAGVSPVAEEPEGESVSLPSGYTLPMVVSEPDPEQVLAALVHVQDGPVVAFDVETTSLDPNNGTLLLLQLSNGTNTSVFDMTKMDDQSRGPIREYLESSEHLFVAHNAKFDFGWLATKLGSEFIVPRMYCSMLAEQVLRGGAEHGGNSLAMVAARYLGIEMDKSVRSSFVDKEPDPYTGEFLFSEAELQYAAIDVWCLPPIFAKQAQKLGSSNLTDIARLEFALAKVVSRMERRGVLIDRVAWVKEVESAKERCAELEAQMKEIVGNEKFNPRSTKQVGEAFRELGFVLGKTDRGTLEKVRHPLAEAMLEWRRVAVLRDRYGDGWLARADDEDRVHAQFVQLGAATGRFSSRDPNLQQLPRGDLLRKAFIAGAGRKMITADYSQIEIRLLGEMSGDENMIRLFEGGADIHAATAKGMFKLDEMPDKDSKYRQMAKSVNFGLMYGAGAKNLQGQLAASKPPVDVSLAEAEHLIKLYFDQFPQAKKWLDAQSSRAYAAMDDGNPVITTTIGGRRRVFPVTRSMSPYDRGHIARQTRNTPIQGGSADITKQAMVLLDEEFAKHPEWDAHVLMTIHDEIVAECKEEYANEVAWATEAKMIEGAKMYMKRCPVKVDYAIADHWSK